MRKLLLFGLLVLAVIVVSCAPHGNGDTALVGHGGGALVPVAATSCDKDAKCEMKSAEVSGAAYINSAKIGSNVQNPQPTVIIDVEQAAFRRRAEFSQGVDIFGDLRVQPQATVDIMGLRGNDGDAFVCTTGDGRLFRSNVPCPEADGCWDRDSGDLNGNTRATVSGLDFNGNYKEFNDHCVLNNEQVERCQGEGCRLWEGGCAALEEGPRVTEMPVVCPNECFDGTCR